MNKILLAFLVSSVFLSGNALASDFIHRVCVPKRWTIAGANSQYNYLYYYDSQTVEIKNKYNPFGDKIVVLWGLTHWTEHGPYYDGNRINNYEINIDKRTYKMLDIEKPTVHNIRPDSIEEALWEVAKTLY